MNPVAPNATAVPDLQGSNPYVGPRSFEEGQKLYGRAVESREIRNLMVSSRVVLLHSASGAGKTSLIRASLLEELEGDGSHVLMVHRLQDLSPLSDEENPYLRALVLSFPGPNEDGGASELGSALSRAEYSLEGFLFEWRRRVGLPHDHRLVLIFDQFEEVFRDASAEEHRVRFFQELGNALRDRNTSALLSMREEFVGQFETYLPYFPAGLPKRYRLLPLSEPAAREAIIGPACDHGLDLEPQVVSDLLKDLQIVPVLLPNGDMQDRRGTYIEPLFLQMVCVKLWERWRARVGDEGRDSIIGMPDRGGVTVDGALAEYYEARVRDAATPEVPEGMIRDWIQRALIMGQARNPVTLGSELANELPGEILRRLSASLLLRMEIRGASAWYELPHDRLVKPITTANDRWFRKFPVFELARRWERTRDPAHLVTDRELLEKLKAQASGTRLETEFLRQSEAAARKRMEQVRRKVFMAWGAVPIVGLIVALVALVYVQDQKWSRWYPILNQRLDLQNELQVRTFQELREEIVPDQQSFFRDPKVIAQPKLPAGYEGLLMSERQMAIQMLSTRPPPTRDRVRIVVEEGRLDPAGAELLSQRRYPVANTPQGGRVVNAMTFGDSVPLDVVRDVAYALWASGRPMNRIRYTYKPLPDENGHDQEVPSVQDDFVIRLTHEDGIREWFPLTIRQIERLHLPPDFRVP